MLELDTFSREQSAVFQTQVIENHTDYLRFDHNSGTREAAQQTRRVHCEALVLHTTVMNLYSWRSAPSQHHGRRQRRDAHVRFGERGSQEGILYRPHAKYTPGIPSCSVY